MNGTVNTVTLIGNVGIKPTLKTFENGSSVCKFTLATSESYTKKDTNEKVNKTQWHTIIVKNKLAPSIAAFVDKGSKVAILGKIETRKFTTPEKGDQYITEIIANHVEFLTPKKQDSQITQ